MKAIDHYIEYSGCDLTEKDAIEGGYHQLSGIELHERMVDKRIHGDYIMGYRFVTQVYANGEVEGVNDVGTYDQGTWMIDKENHTLTLKWKNGWIDTVTRAYDINGNIEFFDVNSGSWRTNFKKTENL